MQPVNIDTPIIIIIIISLNRHVVTLWLMIEDILLYDVTDCIVTSSRRNKHLPDYGNKNCVFIYLYQ